MIKVYEAIRQNNARLVTTYLNVPVTLNFVDGNIYAGKNATLRTNNKFIQDAIENDSRFGVTIKLKQKIAEESDKDEEAQPRTAEPSGNAEGTVAKGKKARGKREGSESSVAEGAEVVESVKTVNDAVDYFAEKGELLESPEQVEELCKRYGVTFPNLKV